jgi:hypothetical protein
MHKKLTIASILLALTGSFLAFLDARRTSYGFSEGGVRLGLGADYYTWFWRHCGEIAFICLFVAFALEFIAIVFCKADTMQSIHISGYKRLGLVCSGVWMLLAVTAYFLGICIHQSFIATTLKKFYIWVPAPDWAQPSRPDPTFDGFGFSLFVFLPVVVGWLLLYVIPRSIHWVRDGFQHDHKHDA